MNKVLFFFLIVITSFNAAAQKSIYDFKINSIDGKSIDFNDYQGKKILIVNTASSGEQASQLDSLAQLYNQFKDSNLVIIAFPSNDFSNETKSNEDIASSYKNNYKINFPVVVKCAVDGTAITPFYKWLTNQSQNGVLTNEIRKDFQKFLINGKGKIIGVFSSLLQPTSPIIIETIRNN